MSKKTEFKKSTIRNGYEDEVELKDETVPIIMEQVKNIISNVTNLNNRSSNRKAPQPISCMKYAVKKKEMKD